MQGNQKQGSYLFISIYSIPSARLFNGQSNSLIKYEHFFTPYYILGTLLGARGDNGSENQVPRLEEVYIHRYAGVGVGHTKKNVKSGDKW